MSFGMCAERACFGFFECVTSPLSISRVRTGAGSSPFQLARQASSGQAEKNKGKPESEREKDRTEEMTERNIYKHAQQESNPGKRGEQRPSISDSN